MTDEHKKGWFQHVFWATGFRPFFLFGGIVAILWVGLWLLSLNGQIHHLGGQMGALSWHSHEMLFGFVVAILAGFFLTAVQNWTRRTTTSGFGLFALFSLWLLGRILVFSSQFIPFYIVAAVDIAFLPALAVVIGIPIWKSKNWRNAGFVPLFLIMAFANTMIYLEFLLGWAGWASRGVELAFMGILTIIATVGGRVLPFFTMSQFRRSGIDVTLPKRQRLGQIGIILLLAMILTDQLGLSGKVWGSLSIAAGIVFGLRLSGWKTYKTLKYPIVWILHLGYASLSLGLILRGLEGFKSGTHCPVATHLLALGVMGILILGMISRVSLGHTGRQLEVQPLMVIGYFSIIIAVLARVLTPMFMPVSWYQHGLLVAGLFWCFSFSIYIFLFTPILTRPRPDGRQG